MRPHPSIDIIVLVALLGGPLGACTAPTPRAPEPAAMPAASHTPRIELLACDDCPNAAPLAQRLRQALRDHAPGWSFIQVNQDALPTNDPRRAWPSPTILIDDDDLFGMRRPTHAGLTCRAFPDGLPDANTIRRALAGLPR